VEDLSAFDRTFCPRKPVASADLHLAIQHLLLSANFQIHSQLGIFQKAGQFPAAESIDVPLSEEAQRFYKSGRLRDRRLARFWHGSDIPTWMTNIGF
jgi:hypothetical protein